MIVAKEQSVDFLQVWPATHVQIKRCYVKIPDAGVIGCVQECGRITLSN